ncbi:TPA: glycosyltransferase family 39 protein [Bacillus toyonensis]|nr:glycosyltransferase family 39 protein [Bacillus toyonensis]
MNVKINNLLLVYIAVLFLAIFVSSAIQNITIIFSLVVLNILVYRRLNLNKPIICLLGILLTSIFVIIVYIQYYNAINLGFSDGNLLGKIGENYYADTKNYYDESQQLVQILFSQNFKYWLAGDFPHFGFYGPYNAYNILNAVLISIFGPNLLTLILLKLKVSILSYYVLYKIVINYLNDKWAIFSIMLYELYPANLLVISTLSRDNINSFLVILVCYYCIYFVGNNFENKVKYTIKILITLIFLFLFRSYAAPITIISLSCAYFFSKKQPVKNYLLVTILMIVVVIGCYVYGFENVQNKFTLNDGTQPWIAERSKGWNLAIYSVLYSFLGQTTVLKNYDLSAFSEFLNLSSFYYQNFILMFSFVAIMILMVIGKKQKDTWIWLLCCIMPILFIFLITSVYGLPIPRLYNMWIWLNCLLIGVVINRFREKLLFLGLVSFGLIVILTVFLVK